jgi:hypothetical protein
MGRQAHTIHVRLPPDLLEKFKTFHEKNFGGLQSSLILRLLILNQLEKKEEDLAEIILEQMQGKKGGIKIGSNRIGTNTRGS